MFDPHDLNSVLRYFGINIDSSSSSRTRADSERRRKFAERWNERRPGDAITHLQSISTRLEFRQAAREATVNKLRDGLNDFVTHQRPCTCGGTAWEPREVREIKIVELKFRHECSVPKYVQCGGCDAKCRLNPISFDYFPGNPEQEVSARASNWAAV